MATISSDNLSILQAQEVRADVEIWRGPVRGDFDEADLADPWLPAGPDWEDVSDQVLIDGRLDVTHDGQGSRFPLSIADERKDEWADDCAVAVVARARLTSIDSGRVLVGWGYLPGQGRQRITPTGDQIGERLASYASYWDRTNLPAHRLGRVNLAEGATVEASTSPLASVTAEAPLEYISQDDNAAAKAIDQEADTVYIGDIIADPTQPTIGSSSEVQILRLYAGRTTRTIGAGNEPIWIELCYVRAVSTWGAMTSSGAVPDLFEMGSEVRNDAAVVSTITTSGPDGAYYQVKSKTGQPSPTVSNGVQWNESLGLPDRPAKLLLEYKAAAPASIGRGIRVTFKPLDPGASGIVGTLALGSGWQTYEADLSDLTEYGGYVLRVQNAPGEVAAADLDWRFRFKVYVGYSDLGQGGSQNKLHLSYDDGNGHTDTLRIAWDLANGAEDWQIPPLGSVILTDDLATFRAKFDPGQRQVFQLRNLAPDWFFGPGIGKVALRRGNGFRYQQYNPSGYTLVQEVNFVTNGLSWTPSQGLSRQSPIGTGSLTVEDYPHVGLLPGAYGGGYIWLDLGAYQPTVLAFPMDSTQLTMTVEDGDRISLGVLHKIGTEQVLPSARDENTFVIARAQNSTSAAAHNPGDSITPRPGGADQTGPTWDTIEIRRKRGTPAIKSGVVIASNLISPGDPSTGGSLWERHADWFLVSRFDNPAQSDVIALSPPGGQVQARHVCVGDVLMHYYQGQPQRLKINEIVVREILPGSSTAGGWAGHGASNNAEAAAHMLTQHGGMPPTKLTIAASPAPMGDLPITPATLAQVLDNLAGDELRIWLDPYNGATIAPDPSSPLYDAREPYLTIDASVLISDPAVDWGDRQPVAQIRLTARETASLRTYVVTYPQRPASLGKVVDVGPVSVRSYADAFRAAERIFRARNVRRTPQNVTIGPAPWLRPWLRVLYDVAALDASGAVQGVNCAITAYTHHFADDGAGLVWTADLSLQEIIV